MASNSPLTGKTLLQKVDQLSHLSRRELARQCGYVTQTKTGKQRVNLTGFYDAILAAKGMKLDPNASQDRRGREATYRARVHQNGQLIIGPAYTQRLGAEPGDEFEIKLGYKHIQLKRVDSQDITEEMDEDQMDGSEASEADEGVDEGVNEVDEVDEEVVEMPKTPRRGGRRKKKIEE